jgi:hypothetical protein
VQFAAAVKMLLKNRAMRASLGAQAADAGVAGGRAQ